MKMTASLVLIIFSLICFGLLPEVEALSPPPDRDYPGGNTAEGVHALFSLTTGTYNRAVGWKSLQLNNTGRYNTAVGAASLFFNFAEENTATGAFALFANNGDNNTATGAGALFSNTTGESNTPTGTFALFSNTTGGANIALDYNAGFHLTTGGNNIDIGNNGQAAESDTIRIGTSQTRTFIAGISGATVTGTPVVVNANGQLGGAPSSQRFKDEIKSMDNTSEAILALKPVTFRYKKDIDPDGIPQFGLVAEDVEKVNPDLVGARQRRKALHRALRSGERDAAQRVSQKTPQSAGARSDNRAAKEGFPNNRGAAHCASRSPRGATPEGERQLEANKPTPQVVANNQ